MISLMRSLHHLMNLIAEAALEIFSPNHDDYPSVGEQPVEKDAIEQGELNHQFKAEISQ